MILNHTTLLKNKDSIIRRGLLKSKARGRRKAVWLASSDKDNWAMRHLLTKKGGNAGTLCRFTVDVPIEWLRRFGDGTWYCDRDIPPDRLVSFTTLEEVTTPLAGRVMA